MGSKGKFVKGLLILAFGLIVLCIASSTAVHEFIVSALGS